MTLRIYIDSCALNRLTDPASQPRIQQEKFAVASIFQFIQSGKVSWIASSILETEIRRNPNINSREAALDRLDFAAELKQPDPSATLRASLLHAAGYGIFDALHLAIAEASNVDWFITTDDRFLRKIQRSIGNPTIPAANPLDWVQQVKP